MARKFYQQLKELEHEHPGAMILLLDGQGNYLYVNDKARAVLGYKPGEVVGHSALEFAAPADIAHSAAALEDAMLNGESVTVNIHVRTRSGALRPVRGAAQRVDDPKTGEVYLLGWVSLV